MVDNGAGKGQQNPPRPSPSETHSLKNSYPSVRIYSFKRHLGTGTVAHQVRPPSVMLASLMSPGFSISTPAPWFVGLGKQWKTVVYLAPTPTREIQIAAGFEFSQTQPL